MSDLLPAQLSFRVIQATGAVGRKSLAALDHLLILLPHRAPVSAWKRVPEAARLRAELRKLAGDEEQQVLHSRLTAGPGITVALLPAGASRGDVFRTLKFSGELLAGVLTRQPRRIGLLAGGFDKKNADRVVRALLLAAGAHTFRLPEYRRKPATAARLRQIVVLGLDSKLDLARTLIEIEAVNLVRWLTALPPNKLTTTGYRELLAQLSEHHDWNMRFLDVAALKRLGAGAFLAVAQGNASSDAGIAHLSLRPRGSSRPDVSLVGKGIIFDTGGTNLKPFRAMLDMHHDMCGSAVAVAVMLAITRLKLPLAVDCWLAITENRIAAQAYKPRDVVRAADGTTIEVIHTDAEGRMALADTLVLAAREKPRLLLDYATLTGQCINALTERYSGVFSNRARLNDALVSAGRDCGERVWPFPMDEDYDEEIKSGVADVQQCAIENEGDHILAARFLQRFVPQAIPWVHMDLSSATRKKGLAQVPAGPTGFGVRFTLNLLVDRATELDALLAPPARD